MSADQGPCTMPKGKRVPSFSKKRKRQDSLLTSSSAPLGRASDDAFPSSLQLLAVAERCGPPSESFPPVPSPEAVAGLRDDPDLVVVSDGDSTSTTDEQHEEGQSPSEQFYQALLDPKSIPTSGTYNGQSYQAPSQPSQEWLKSLAFLEMENRWKDIDAAAEGTCEWLHRHCEYRNWATCDRGMFWIKGKPGSGKSTLLRYALDNIIAASKIDTSVLVLSYFFHGRGVQLQKTPLGLFRSLLHQLLSQVPAASPELVAAYQQRCNTLGEQGEKWEWHLRELQGFLKSTLMKVLGNRPVWLLVDALDESGEENAVQLVKYFQSLIQTPQTDSQHFHICFTCRHYPILDVNGAFQLCLEDENKDDISTFIRTELFTLCQKRPSILSIITAHAAGVFMWARLVVDRVQTQRRKNESLHTIEKKILSLPRQLGDLYNNLIQDMKDNPASLRLMQWICFAERPLSLNEMRWAMVVEGDCTYQSLQDCWNADEDFACDCDNMCCCDTMETRVKDLSCGLAETIASSSNRVIQFIHQSVRDFFIDKGLSTLNGSDSTRTSTFNTRLTVGIAHDQLSRTCIRYLAMSEIRLATKEFNPSLALKSNFPLLHYAATSWISHLKKSEEENSRHEAKDSQGGFLSVFSWPSEALLQLWVQVYGMIDEYSDARPPSKTSMVHIVSQYQLLRSLRRILQIEDQARIDIDIDGMDGNDRTPLSWAAENGHEAVVQLLLATGKVEINAKDNWGHTPLWWAAGAGHEAVVQLLLATDKIEADAKDYDNQTPLRLAASNGYWAIVQLLLATDKVDADAKDNSGLTPLMSAAGAGHEAVVQLLLATGKVNADAKDSRGRTPLSWAARNGNEAIVQLLLETGKVEADAKDDGGETPLLMAATNDHKNIVQLLLATDKVEADVKDSCGMTPLSFAAKNGNGAIVQLLLATGKVEADAKNHSGMTPLSWAAISSNEAIVKLLLATGKIETDTKDNNGRTPLSWAAANGNKAVVQLLLATNQVEIDGKDNHGRTPLSWAAENNWAASGDHEGVVQLLLATGKVEADAKDNYDGRTPLSWAAASGIKGVVQQLLATGKVEIDAQDHYGHTPLSWAAINGHAIIVQLLFATGKTEIDAKDNKGRTPLWWAAENGCGAVVQLLLATGKVEADAKNNDGQTPLEQAAMNGDEAVVRLLLATGKVEVETPLLRAAWRGHQAIVQLLQAHSSSNISKASIGVGFE